MKELRFDAADGVWRVAFAFDPKRRAILLVAGYNAGTTEKRFYRRLIEKKDERFSAHLRRLEGHKRRHPMKTLKDVVNGLPAQRRAKVEARAEELIAEEMTLRDLRKARDLTQQRMAELLGVGQDNISRLESRADMLLSTLRSYVSAMGGSLDLVVRFPDRPSVSLSTLFGKEQADEKSRRRRGEENRAEHRPA